jgi:hypothetical protein
MSVGSENHLCKHLKISREKNVSTLQEGFTSVYLDHTVQVSISDLQSANENQRSFARIRFTEFTA